MRDYIIRNLQGVYGTLHKVLSLLPVFQLSSCPPSQRPPPALWSPSPSMRASPWRVKPKGTLSQSEFWVSYSTIPYPADGRGTTQESSLAAQQTAYHRPSIWHVNLFLAVWFHGVKSCTYCECQHWTLNTLCTFGWNTCDIFKVYVECYQWLIELLIL